jgi:AraC-like DNA-binding protein
MLFVFLISSVSVSWITIQGAFLYRFSPYIFYIVILILEIRNIDLKLFIKYMVSNRCKTAVKEELRKLDLHFIVVDLGEVEIMEELTPEQRKQLKEALFVIGLDLLDDKKALLIEKVKSIIVDMVHHSNEKLKVNFSDYLSEKIGYDYTYIANLFAQLQGTTVEQFIISHKVERIKELLIYGKLNVTEIAWDMNYSSVAHLSTQFKKITGLTPTQFKHLKSSMPKTLEEAEKNS